MRCPNASRCYPPVAVAFDIPHENINASPGERVRGALHIQTVNAITAGSRASCAVSAASPPSIRTAICGDSISSDSAIGHRSERASRRRWPDRASVLQIELILINFSRNLNALTESPYPKSITSIYFFSSFIKPLPRGRSLAAIIGGGTSPASASYVEAGGDFAKIARLSCRNSRIYSGLAVTNTCKLRIVTINCVLGLSTSSRSRPAATIPCASADLLYQSTRWN